MPGFENDLSTVPFDRAESTLVRRVDEVPNFELVGKIGGSRFGDVWLARERLTGVSRAIKFLDKRERRLAEIDLAGVRHIQQAAHDHPHLLPILAVGETENCFHYVMEAADSEPPGRDGLRRPSTLRATLQRVGRFGASEALTLVQKLASGVAHLHAQGLTHNDLKPENILFVRGEPKIADVGLARPKDGQTGAGTRGYMAPDGPDDVYALGRILYELQSGLALSEFPRLTPEAYERPAAEVAAALRIIDKACRPRRADRFGGASELLTAIERELRTLRSRMARRRRLIVAGICCAAAIPLTWASWMLFRPVPQIALRQSGEIYTALRIPSYTVIPRRLHPSGSLKVPLITSFAPQATTMSL
ncbi:MAG: serine/threonine-protein kinase [Phycisphaerae bacterium]